MLTIPLLILYLLTLGTLHFFGNTLRNRPFLKKLDLSLRGLVSALLVAVLVSCAVTASSSVAALIGLAHGEDTPLLGTVAGAPALTELPSEVESWTEASSEGATVPTRTTAEEPVETPSSGAPVPGAAESEVVAEAQSTPTEMHPAQAETAPVLSETAESGRYADGTYTGTGDGFRGPVEVSVTVVGGRIDAIEVVSQREDRKWFQRAYQGITERVLAAQGTEVDTVSGATYSSLGLLEGIRNALAEAVR